MTSPLAKAELRRRMRSLRRQLALDYPAAAEALACRLPLERQWALRGTRVMERIGPRLLPRGGGLYCLAASKRRFAVRPLRLQWQRLPVYATPAQRLPAGRAAA